MRPMRMEQVEVFIGWDGHICIATDSDGMTQEPAVIVLCPEQVDLIVKWLKELKPYSERALVEHAEKEDGAQ